MGNLICNESTFARELGRSLSQNLSDEQKRVLQIRYGLDYGGLVNFANAYLRRLSKAIKKRRMSMDGFGFDDADSFAVLLFCDRLDKNLRSELSHLLYGADERRQYFHWNHFMKVRSAFPVAFSYLDFWIEIISFVIILKNVVVISTTFFLFGNRK